jgi:catechol 2,3-dioxygenase-like lactoylglutathione lyase family enzyme
VLDVEKVDFVSVPVRDRERARKFYGETLGLERNAGVPEPWTEFEISNVTLAIWEPESQGVPFAPNPAGIALRVPDVVQARKKLEESGVEFHGDTLDTGVCHMAFFADPDGNYLILHRRYAPRAS